MALWQVLFASMVAWGPAGGDAASLLLPPAVALLVPVVFLTSRRWWGEPWLVGLPARRSWGPLASVLALEALVVLQLQPPPGLVLLAFLLTGVSEELATRGAVQQLLQLVQLPRVLEVLLTGSLLALGYAVTLTLLDEGTGKIVLVAGTVLCFGVAHAALRRRGVPVVLLAPMGALVVWPQAALDGYDPLTFVASVIALVLGVWATVDEPTGRG